MSSPTDIKAKWDNLKRKGVDLGHPTGTETDTPFQGRVQQYEHGNIYWHKDHGAHEVHGGILRKYLALGGPGPDPVTHRSNLGFPTTDEQPTFDGLYPMSQFEHGVIEWVQGTDGGVALFGDFYDRWANLGREHGDLLHPVRDAMALAGGQAVYFQRGVLWKGAATAGRIITGRFHTALMGRPRLIDPDNEQERRFPDLLTWDPYLRTEVESHHSDVYTRLAGFFVLQPVGARARNANVALQVEPTGADSLRVNLAAPLDGPAPLQDRTLYNIALQFEDGPVVPVAPHAVYLHRDTSAFGLAHITDIHVARRIDGFRRRLRQAAALEPSLSPGVDALDDWNDAFRHFVRYANHLHDIGQLDLVLATGDLVDYAFDSSDEEQGGGNYAFFERLIRGQAPGPDGVANEELRVPIFTIFGNHDYRLNPYRLLFRVNQPIVGPLSIPLTEVPLFGGYNLVAEEARALELDGITADLPDPIRRIFLPEVSPGAALEMVEIDHANQRLAYDYYLHHINGMDSYTVKLGPHRFVMINSGTDLGIPSDADLGTILTLLGRYITGSLSGDTMQAAGGAPNQRGFSFEDGDRVHRALDEAGREGVVIVGVHAPPVHIKGAEFSHYFRETEHPAARIRETLGFLFRHIELGLLKVVVIAAFGEGHSVEEIRGIATGEKPDTLSHEEWVKLLDAARRCLKYDGWLQEGTTSFKVGQVDDFVDDGVAKGLVENFLRICIGGGQSRPVDLMLCGHNHDRYEMRVKWQADRNQFAYYTDFYTENPSTYYPSKMVGIKSPVQVRVVRGATGKDRPRPVGAPWGGPDHRPWSVDIPPYARPLSETQDPRAWWGAHRPIIAETAALGPIDRHQRGPGVPPPTFQGFRLLTVRENCICQCRYITLPDVVAHNFVLPWERVAAYSSDIPVSPVVPVTS